MADTLKSKQLSSFMHDPGVFYTDNPYAHPHLPLDSKDDKITNAPFHCHVVRDAQQDVYNYYFAGHVIYGDSRKMRIGFKGKAQAAKWNHISGGAHLFTSYRGPKRTSKDGDYTGSDGDQQSGRCLQLGSWNTNQIPGLRGILMGLELPDEILLRDKNDKAKADAVFDAKARWCAPLGVQFRWSSRGSHQKGAALNFNRIGLLYMDNWMPGRTLYMPLVETPDDSDFGEFVNRRSYYRGSDPLGQAYSRDNIAAQGQYGEVVAYAENEVIDYMAAPYTRAICVGMYIEIYQPEGQLAVYDMAKEIFDFKFLFDMPDKQGNMFASKSRFIYPAPYPLKDAFDSKNIKLL